jgi:hypothetical protein
MSPQHVVTLGEAWEARIDHPYPYVKLTLVVYLIRFVLRLRTTYNMMVRRKK